MKILKATIIFSLLTVTATGIKAIAGSDVGIHVGFSEIKSNFHRHLVKYVGECPGEKWSGLGADGDLRFISHQTKPNKKLKVTLINLTTGKKITRDYKKSELGSNDFNLRQLGNSNGEHDVEYKIYNKSTKKTIESGNFTYNITSSQETEWRYGEWKQELYCAEDNKIKIKDCNIVGSKEVKYCQDKKTGEFRDQQIIYPYREEIEIDIDIY